MGYFQSFQKKDYVLDDTMTKSLTDISAYTSIFSKIADDISFYSYYTMQNGERLDTISTQLYGTPEFYWTIPLINPHIVNVYIDMPKDTPEFIEYLASKYQGSAFKLKPLQSMVDKFTIGETLVYNDVNKATLLGKYPTQGYLQVQLTEGEFPENMDFTITGQTSNDSVIIANLIPAYDAPAYHTSSITGMQCTWNITQSTETSIRELEQEKNDLVSQIKVIRPTYIYEVVKQFEREMKRK